MGGRVVGLAEPYRHCPDLLLWLVPCVAKGLPDFATAPPFAASGRVRLVVTEKTRGTSP